MTFLPDRSFCDPCDRSSLPSPLQRYVEYEHAFTTDVPRITALFENFVAAYDGLAVFDPHMRLQTGMLVANRTTGEMAALDFVGEGGPRTGETWKEVAAKFGVTGLKVLHNRGPYPRRFDVPGLQAKTVRKVCTFVALDLCCLNFALPPPCQQGGADDDGIPEVRCQWVQEEDKWMIEPVLI